MKNIFFLGLLGGEKEFRSHLPTQLKALYFINEYWVRKDLFPDR